MIRKKVVERKMGKVIKIKVTYSSCEERDEHIDNMLYEGFVVTAIYGSTNGEIPLTAEFEWRE